MSEDNTPQYPHSSPDENDNLVSNDSLDELLASLDDPSSSETEANLDEPLFPEEPVESNLENHQAEEFNNPEQTTENHKNEELSNEVLYEQNHQLLYRNAQLQKALENTQAELEQQKFQLRQAEDLNEQQSDELNAAYEQHLSLSQELKTARQKGEYQQEQISHLRHSLQTSQQRVAQLERECAVIQKQFQEQSYKLSQAEKELRELSLRLQQQRRYTWQFKLALNKYLENNPDANSDSSLPIPSVSSQPIPAWSAQHHKDSTPTEDIPDFNSDVSEDQQEDDLLAEIESQLDQEEILEPIETSQTDLETKEGSWLDIEETSTSGKDETSPSPILNRKESRKKRKSYASVQLPNFIR